MMIKKQLMVVALFLVIVTPSAFARSIAISNYHATFIPLYDQKGELNIAIRMYEKEKVPYFLAVNPYTLATKSVRASDFTSSKYDSSRTIVHYNFEEIKNTPYYKALTTYSSPPYILQNYGIKEATKPVVGQFLTIDMCPSARPFEAKFYRSLVAKSDQLKRPIPIGISISGLWIINHPSEFQWLIEQEQKNKFQITWINHSFSHVYYPDVSLAKNFLLSPETNFTEEVLQTEKLLLIHGQTPSVFFRFPGLISAKKLILELKQFGLIPIGSNAWLAKDQPIHNGSIILVHGNSNEPLGIEKLMNVLWRADIHFLPINEVIQP